MPNNKAKQKKYTKKQIKFRGNEVKLKQNGQDDKNATNVQFERIYNLWNGIFNRRLF